MERVRYPFIVRYLYHKDLAIKFGKELGDGAYERTEEEEEATVYTDLKMFKQGFRTSPTGYLRKFERNKGRSSDVRLIYVGE